MPLSKLETFKLESLQATYGLMTVEELQTLYKESMSIYAQLPSWDIAKSKFQQDCIDFRKYGNFLVRSTLEDESMLNYQINIHAVSSWREHRTRDDNGRVVKELALLVNANSYIPGPMYVFFHSTAFIMPTKDTDHGTLVEYLQEYSMPFERTTTEFTFIEM